MAHPTNVMSGQMLLTFTTRDDAGEDPLLQQGLALETEVPGLETSMHLRSEAWPAEPSGGDLYPPVRSEALKRFVSHWCLAT